MTDRERYLQLFRDTNVPCRETKDHEGVDCLEVGDEDIWVKPPEEGVVRCYPGFRVRLKFDAAGKLTEFGIWE
jgi:hypothetical protein